MSTFHSNNDAIIERFKHFLQIPTISNELPHGSSKQAMEFLTNLAQQLQLAYEIVEFVSGYPIFLLKLIGQQPSLPAILLNSHYDVVPVMKQHWKYEPFSAFEDEHGDIFARGTQDMKCVCMQYVEAIARLLQKASGSGSGSANDASAAGSMKSPFQRTLYVAFVPDEEVGGYKGTGHWVQSEHFRNLNVGCVLDEGLANPEDAYTVFYGERAVWWTHIKATGPTGHGSRLIKDTANEKLVRVINRLLGFRAEQEALLEGRKAEANETGCAHAVVAEAQHAAQNNNGHHHHHHHHHDHGHDHHHHSFAYGHDADHRKELSALTRPLELGDVVTVNLTMLRSGVTTDNGATFSINVIPMEAEAGFDIRIPPTFALDKFEELLKQWTKEEGLTYDFFQKVEKHSLSSINEEENAYWRTFAEVMKTLNRKICPTIFPAGTDGRYFREIGIPVFGFSPIRLQPILLHDHNEKLNRNVYLEGIEVYEKLIPAMCNSHAA
jgi:aminoacylase